MQAVRRWQSRAVAAGFPVTELNKRRRPRGANERVTTSVRWRGLPGDALVELEVEQLNLL